MDTLDNISIEMTGWEISDEAKSAIRDSPGVPKDTSSSDFMNNIIGEYYKD